MSEIAETTGRALKHAAFIAMVPPYAKFEIRWAKDSPGETGRVYNPGELEAMEQELNGKHEGTGPVVIACFDD